MASYRIRILEVGYDPKFPAGIAFDFWNMGDEQAYSPFSMTLIEGEGRTILFDCGMDPKKKFAADKIAMEQDQNCRDPQQVLGSIGLDTGKIDAVVLSHCHWDHMSGISFFPNAEIYVQEKELLEWNRAMADERFPLTHKLVVDPQSLDELNDCVRQGRVKLLRGDVAELFPGISVKCATGHSFAQNMLFIEDERCGRYAIIGDVAMRPESFLGTKELPCYLPNLKFAVGGIESITASYAAVMDWVGGDVSHIVMTHDGTRHTGEKTAQSPLGLDVTELT